MMSTDKDKKNGKGIIKVIKKVIKAIVGVMGVVVTYVSIVNSWQLKNIEEEQVEIEKRQEENEITPMIKVDYKGTIPLGKNVYAKYKLYNVENNLAGGKLKNVTAIVIVKCAEKRIKTLGIKDAVYEMEIPFDAEQQCSTVFFKEPDEIEMKVENLNDKLEKSLARWGQTNVFDYEVHIGIFVTLEFSDKNNEMKEKQYIIYLEKEPYCELIADEEAHCDKYQLEYGIEEQGEEYTAVISEIVERIKEVCKGN